MLEEIKLQQVLPQEIEKRSFEIITEELAKYGGEVYCFMSDEDVAAKAKEQGSTGAVYRRTRQEGWQ